MRAKHCICALLAAVLCLATVGCDKSGRGETATDRLVVNDFERYDTCFAPMIIENYFGRVTMNRDKAYVRSGEASARLEPIGDPSRTSGQPTLTMPLNLIKKGLDARDMSQALMVEANFFNASDADIEAGMYLSYVGGRTDAQTTVLVPGVWTSAYFVIDRAQLAFSADLTVMQQLSFVMPVAADASAPPSVYLDDVIVHKTDQPFRPVDMTFDDNELIGFEKPWHLYAVSGVSDDSLHKPTLSINTDPEYARSGSSLLVSYPGNNNDATTWGYAGVSLARSLLENSGLREKGDDVRLEFDVYNPQKRQVRLFVEALNDAGNMFFKTELYVPAGEWATGSYSIRELNAGKPATYTGSHTGPGRLAAGGGTESIASLRLRWDYYTEPAGTHELYIDSFRLI